MSFITSSKLFQASDHKDKILAAISDPINKELVQQLESYVRVSDVIKDDNVDKKDYVEDVNRGGQSSSGDEDTTELGAKSSNHSYSDKGRSSKNLDDIDDEVSETDSDNIPDNENSGSEVSDISPKSADEDDNIEQSTSIDGKQPIKSATILSDTYITIDMVSHAVNELPGALNLQADTKGVDYAALRTNANSANEVWVYYDKDIDISKVINPVVTYLFSAGYYYLEFNRVSRLDNALVFMVNWVSNYFNVKQIVNDEK